MPGAFLFDIGRVLVQFDFARAFRALAPLASADMTAAEAEIRALLTPLETGTLSTDEFVDRSVRILGGGVTAEHFTAAYCGIFWPHPQMEAIVARLAGQYPLYLFSNTSELHERWLMDHYPVFQHFRGGIFSWRAGSMKPHDEIYRQAIALTGQAAERIAYIDDLPDNIAAGRRMGMITHQYDASRHAAFEEWLAALLSARA